MKNLNMEVSYGVKMPLDKLDEWQQKANQYTCTLKFDNRQMTIPYFMGPALSREPEINDVMQSLVSDYYCAQEPTFEDFCASLGYDDDSRKAEQIYKQCKRQSEKLEKLLGTEFDRIIENYL